MSRYRYKIGQIGLEYDLGPLNIEEDEFTEGFKIDDFCNFDKVVKYECMLSDFADKKQKPYIQGNGTFLRYEEDGRTELVYHWDKLRYALAYYPGDIITLQKMESLRLPYRIHPRLPQEKPHMDMIRLMDYLGLHAIFLFSGYLLLHASYIDWHGQGILFTAPSQTGKSTQAELWRQYEDADIINGDRALIGYHAGAWYTYGYPECGSSAISKNVTRPLRAILVLEQDNENHLEEMTVGEQVKALVAATKLWTWSLDQIDQAIENASKVISEVPVVKLKCTPDRRAVMVLKDYLSKSL